MSSRIHRVLVMALVVATLALAFGARSYAAESDRKVKSKVQPIYPELARRMSISGTVKVEIIVAANGSVKSAKVIGGNPVLVNSAVDAVKKWRYETGTEETTQVVEFRFAPTQ